MTLKSLLVALVGGGLAVVGCAGIGQRIEPPEVFVVDPLVDRGRIAAHGFEEAPRDLALNRADLAVVLTDHDAVDYLDIAANAELVLDSRDAYRRRGFIVDHVSTL